MIDTRVNLHDHTKEMLDGNELRINLIVTIILIVIDVSLLIQVFTNTAAANVTVFCGVPAILLSLVIVLNLVFSRHLHHWVKNVNMIVMLISFMLVGEINHSEFFMLFILPSFLSSFYYYPKYTVISSAASLVTLWVVMFNRVDFSHGTQMEDFDLQNLFSILSKAFDFSTVSELASVGRICMFVFAAAMMSIAIYMSFSGRIFYYRQAMLLNDNAASKAELIMARSIQDGAMSHDFPDNEFYSVYGDMVTASKVGGDFYDQFMVDDTHLALVVGDVSGHGMAAAMFMMLSMTLIKVNVQSGYSCDKAISRTNKYLVSANPQKFFVTCWLGIIDLTTGELCYTNAGHNYPVLLRKGQRAEFLKSKTDFVLGRRRLAPYSEKHIKLNEGDRLVLYTDGVTEAVSRQDEFFGDERLLEALSACGSESAQRLVYLIWKAVDTFSKDRVPSDDITIEAFDLKKLMSQPQYETKNFFLTMESFDSVQEYISGRCKEYGCSTDVVYNILAASSEILANIESYAYEDGGEIEIMTISRGRRVCIVFKDSGEPFDPLLAKKPDVTLPLEQRSPGGLGIHIVCKLMDSVSYRYENGQNVLTIEKDF